MIKHPWPTTEEIKKMHNISLGVITSLDRTWTKFDLSDCKHLTSSMSYAGNYEIETCVYCGKQMSSQCIHGSTEWSPDELLLRCKTCGMDLHE